MGRRSRKRSGSAGAVRPPAPPRDPAPDRRPVVPKSRRARMDEAPKAPWSPFPLVELTILIGLVMVMLGFFTGGDRRPILIGCGFALVSLAGLELSLREHFSGFRSHSALLAGVLVVVVDIPLILLVKPPRLVPLVVAVVVFGIAFWLLRSAFARRTGGLSFRA